MKLAPLSSVLLSSSKRLPLMCPMRRFHVSASAFAGNATFGTSTFKLNEKRSRVPATCGSWRLKPLVWMRESSSGKTVTMPSDVASGTEQILSQSTYYHDK